jgi:uncharacterized protein YcnI
MNPNFLRAAASAAAFACGAAPVAHAHVTLEYQVAPAASSYKATFRVGHGCGTSPTRQLIVQIPAGVRAAKPMVKPGWTAEVVRARLPQPETRHGRPVSEDVVRITWTARSAAEALAADQYDEFSLVSNLPAQPGPLYWPVSQVCAEGRLDWTEVPPPGRPLGELRYPAAALEIIPAGPSAGHSH